MTLIEQLLIRLIKTQSIISRNLCMETKLQPILQWEKQWTSTISLHLWMTFDKQVLEWRLITLCPKLTKCKGLSRCLKHTSLSTRCQTWISSLDTDSISSLLWILWTLVPLLKVFFQTAQLGMTALKDKVKVFRMILLSALHLNLNLNSFWICLLSKISSQTLCKITWLRDKCQIQDFPKSLMNHQITKDLKLPQRV